MDRCKVLNVRRILDLFDIGRGGRGRLRQAIPHFLPIKQPSNTGNGGNLLNVHDIVDISGLGKDSGRRICQAIPCSLPIKQPSNTGNGGNLLSKNRIPSYLSAVRGAGGRLRQAIPQSLPVERQPRSRFPSSTLQVNAVRCAARPCTGPRPENVRGIRWNQWPPRTVRTGGSGFPLRCPRSQYAPPPRPLQGVARQSRHSSPRSRAAPEAMHWSWAHC